MGEGLLVTGFAFVDQESSPESIVAMASAFVAAAAMWWIYFDHGERIGSEAIEASDEPGRLARTAYTWVHLAIIGGIVLVSVGDKESLAHPHAAGLAPTITSLGGPVLFLVGTVLFRHILEHRWARAQLLGHRGAHRARCGVFAAVGLAADSLTLSVDGGRHPGRCRCR